MKIFLFIILFYFVITKDFDFLYPTKKNLQNPCRSNWYMSEGEECNEQEGIFCKMLLTCKSNKCVKGI
jgi:hypothetical protein